MVVMHTLAVKCILLSCIKSIVIRHITQGYTEASILAWYQRNLICQVCITSVTIP